MINIFQKIGWFIKAEWKTYVVLFLLLISISSISLAPAYVLGRSIDTIMSGGLTTRTLATLVFFACVTTYLSLWT
jgi:ATP-binding cassette, subfamily B, multidrug efflux pump